MTASLPTFRQIGFSGADFTDNTLRWQLTTFLLREIYDFDAEKDSVLPLTAWGDRAHLWLTEQGNSLENNIFSFCQVESRRKDHILFMDYCPALKGDHLDFYGNQYLINILCDIAHGHCEHFSEYDLESVAELIKKGYVLRENDSFTVTLPLFTATQSTAAVMLARNFVTEKLGNIIRESNRLSAPILGEHTPKHLQDHVLPISSLVRSINTGIIPIRHLIDSKVLSTDWNPLEMPTTHIELNS